MTICVHGQGDLRVPYDRLDHIGVLVAILVERAQLAEVRNNACDLTASEFAAVESVLPRSLGKGNEM